MSELMLEKWNEAERSCVDHLRQAQVLRSWPQCRLEKLSGAEYDPFVSIILRIVPLELILCHLR